MLNKIRDIPVSFACATEMDRDFLQGIFQRAHRALKRTHECFLNIHISPEGVVNGLELCREISGLLREFDQIYDGGKEQLEDDIASLKNMAVKPEGRYGTA